MIEFHLDGGSGLSPYQQIVRQVRHALRLGLLNEGDQLPTVKDVVAAVIVALPSRIFVAGSYLRFRS